jgi:hypothetical protein
MTTLGILFSEEERAMIYTVVLWEREHPPGQNVPAADVKFPNQDPQLSNNTPGHRENMRDLILLLRFNNKGNPGISAEVTKPL